MDQPSTPVTPQPVAPVASPPPAQNKSKLPLILGSIVALCLVGGIAYYAGAQTGAKNVPTPTVAPSVTQEVVSPTIGLENGEITPATTNKTVIVPKDWKSYTATDPDFGITTTMSLPPGYIFEFTGSDYTLRNESSTELWNFITSVYRNTEGVLKNQYTGQSRRVWYENYLSRGQANSHLTEVVELPINTSTYLRMLVDVPYYDDRGTYTGLGPVYQFLYVQNNIVHVFQPLTEKARASSSEIAQYIEPIFASLSSKLTK